MKKIKFIFAVIGVSFCTMQITSAWAESAPVYDADTLQQQFENAGDMGQDFPASSPQASQTTQETGFVQAPLAQQNAPISTQNSSSPIFADDNSTAQISSRERLNRLEHQVKTMQMSGNTARIETLQTEVQTLRGQVEQMSHQLEQMQAQQKTLYSDLDKRVSQVAINRNSEVNSTPSSVTMPTSKTTDDISDVDIKSKTEIKSQRKIVAKKPVETPSETKSLPPQPNVAEEQQIYQTAYNLIKTKKYTEAVTTLQKMLQKYPSGQFAANAHYWLGELFGLLNKHDQALNEFSTVVDSFSNSPRVSDAQLKVGLIYASQMKWSDAKNVFKKVINHYPGTASARLASEQLKQLKQAGH